MSLYPDGRFIESFAERTKSNLLLIEDIVKDDKNRKACEVTQLINSIIGLLVFPKEGYFNLIPSNTTFLNNEDAMNIFCKYCQNSGEYQYLNTYRKRVNGKPTYEIEDFTIPFLIKRLRNSVSHENINILPQEPKSGTDIESIKFVDKGRQPLLFYKEDHTFIDNDKIKKGEKYEKVFERFSIIINIKDLHILLYAICDLLLDAARHSGDI